MTNDNDDVPQLPWWPPGTRESLVRACTCESCQALVDALEEHRDGIAVDGEHAPLDSFA